MPSPTPDLVIRISLVRDDASLRELNPPIWRTFRVSSSVNLDLLHDKVLVPVMGWTRNYHTYYFRPLPAKGSAAAEGTEATEEAEEEERKSFEERVKTDVSVTQKDGKLEVHCSGDEFNGTVTCRDQIHYVQTDTSASDALHVSSIVDEDKIRAPEDVTIGDFLKKAGDRIIYNYDLGDCWYHLLEVEKVIDAENSDGKVVLMEGEMRCPPEDGDGSAQYQKKILDELLEVKADPGNHVIARQFAETCWPERNRLSVLGSFHPEDFDLEERREALAQAIASRNYARNLVKTFSTGIGFIGKAGIGQRDVIVKVEVDMEDRYGRPVTSNSYHETINVKPDPKDATLCYNCGSPHDLKMAISSFYCSRDCQKTHWENGWKKQAKKEKAAYQTYLQEVETNTPDPNRMNQDGGFVHMKKFVPGKQRFSVGDYVECLLGEDEWGTGRIVKLNYREGRMTETAPYQIKLDRETALRVGRPPQQAFIYSVWDNDLQIRRLEKGLAKKKSPRKGKKGRGKK